MISLRAYQEADAGKILSWCKDETEFYKWTAGILGEYPISVEQFQKVESLMAFTAVDDGEAAGFFTMRNPGDSPEELRFGFVIVSPKRRGQGIGKTMLQLGVNTAEKVYGAKKISLGVFENNLPAYHCYQAAGFRKVRSESPETYTILGERWRCLEMEFLHREKASYNTKTMGIDE